MLRLTASDTEYSAYAELTVTVLNVTNQPPQITVGPAPAVNIAAAAYLTGTATDDGLPAEVLIASWSEATGRTWLLGA